MSKLRKNEIPSLCRLTIAKCTGLKTNDTYVVFVTDNDKIAKVFPYERVGKSFVCRRDCKDSSIDDYPGKELKNGQYIWESDTYPRWTKIK